MLLDGKVAVVSGVGPGMGRDVALALAAEGASLALGARRDRYLRPVAEEVEALGRPVVWQPTDITADGDCRRLAAAAAEAFGGIDVLVNNAGHGGTYAPLAGADPASHRATIEVNLMGTLQMTNAVIPHLEARGGGRIVMVGSNVSGPVVVEHFGSYGMSKAALEHATRHLAVELGGRGIRVNMVLPGAIRGRAFDLYLEEIARRRGIPVEEVLAEQEARTSLGYLPPSSEIAGTVVYLASDLSRPVTGQSIRVDCGQWAAAAQPPVE